MMRCLEEKKRKYKQLSKSEGEETGSGGLEKAQDKASIANIATKVMTDRSMSGNLLRLTGYHIKWFMPLFTSICSSQISLPFG
jgi:hypothetical protein